MGDIFKQDPSAGGEALRRIDNDQRRIDHSDPLPAWEMIEEGRYRPIRTRGSFPGRELG
jgi:hypothetical protein